MFWGYHHCRKQPMYWKKNAGTKTGPSFSPSERNYFWYFWGGARPLFSAKNPHQNFSFFGKIYKFLPSLQKKMPFTWFPTNSDLKAIDSIGVFYKNKKTGKYFLGDSPLPWSSWWKSKNRHPTWEWQSPSRMTCFGPIPPVWGGCPFRISGQLSSIQRTDLPENQRIRP